MMPNKCTGKISNPIFGKGLLWKGGEYIALRYRETLFLA